MAYLTKKQEGERFLAEFLRRLREAPPGTAGGASTHGTAAGTALASGPADRVAISTANWLGEESRCDCFAVRVALAMN
jgi:hypothetical protein